MKKALIILIGIFIFIFKVETQGQTEPQIPGHAVIDIKIVGLPGVKNTKSAWEMSYELRIIDQESFIKLVKSGELMKEESNIKHGEFIGKGEFKKTDLSKPENLHQLLQISLDENIRNKLKIQLEKINSSGKNQIQSEPQIFLFYSNALIYDAQLKKNIFVPFNWILPFERHPKALFETLIQIFEDGSYKKQVILPKDKEKRLQVIKN